eukprot:RCo037569
MLARLAPLPMPPHALLWPGSSNFPTGISYCSTGDLWYTNDSHDQGTPLGAGNEVRVEVDRRAAVEGGSGIVRFSLNGVALGGAIPITFAEDAVFAVTLTGVGEHL